MSKAVVSVLAPARPTCGSPPAHSKTTSAPTPSVASMTAFSDILLTRVDYEYPRPGLSRVSRFVTDVGLMTLPAPLTFRNLHDIVAPITPCPSTATRSPILSSAAATPLTDSLAGWMLAPSLSFDGRGQPDQNIAGKRRTQLKPPGMWGVRAARLAAVLGVAGKAGGTLMARRRAHRRDLYRRLEFLDARLPVRQSPRRARVRRA